MCEDNDFSAKSKKVYTETFSLWARHIVGRIKKQGDGRVSVALALSISSLNYSLIFTFWQFSIFT